MKKWLGVAESMIHPHRVSMTEFDRLKSYLEAANFVMIPHRYTKGICGHTLFFSRQLFDMHFKNSFGTQSGG